MPGPSTPQQAQLTLVFSGAPLPTGAVTTIGLVKTGSPFVPGDLDGLAVAVTPLHTTISTNTCILDHIELKRGPVETGPTYTFAVGAAGGNGENASPPNVALLIRKEIENVSARYSGRMFWPCPDTLDISASGTFSTSYLGLVQTALDNFMAAIQDRDMAPVVYGKGLMPLDFSGITAFRPQSRAATQRRRLRR